MFHKINLPDVSYTGSIILTTLRWLTSRSIYLQIIHSNIKAASVLLAKLVNHGQYIKPHDDMILHAWHSNCPREAHNDWLCVQSKNPSDPRPPCTGVGIHKHPNQILITFTIIMLTLFWLATINFFYHPTKVPTLSVPYSHTLCHCFVYQTGYTMPLYTHHPLRQEDKFLQYTPDCNYCIIMCALQKLS